jgi:hypothetical protein
MLIFFSHFPLEKYMLEGCREYKRGVAALQLLERLTHRSSSREHLLLHG